MKNNRKYGGKPPKKDIRDYKLAKFICPLPESFSLSNLPRVKNQENVRSLLDVVNETFLDSTEEELRTFWPRAINTLSKFNFQVYNHDELNGDLITPDLTDELITKLKVEKSIEENGTIKKIPSTVGFIGSKSSPYL
jgi:hypothetical protein